MYHNEHILQAKLFFNWNLSCFFSPSKTREATFLHWDKLSMKMQAYKEKMSITSSYVTCHCEQMFRYDKQFLGDKSKQTCFIYFLFRGENNEPPSTQICFISFLFRGKNNESSSTSKLIVCQCDQTIHNVFIFKEVSYDFFSFFFLKLNF